MRKRSRKTRVDSGDESDMVDLRDRKRARDASDESENEEDLSMLGMLGDQDLKLVRTRVERDSCFDVIHGSAEEKEELKALLDNYSTADWTDMIQTLISTHIDPDCSDKELLSIFHKFYKVFCHPFKSAQQVLERFSIVFPDTTNLQPRFSSIQKLFGMLHFQLLQRRQIDEDTSTGREIKRMLTQIAFMMKTAYDQLTLTNMLMHGTDSTTKSLLDNMSPELFFQELDMSKLKKHQQILYFYLKKAFNNQYKRDGSALYKPKYNANGIFTHAYEYHRDISQFVFDELFPLEQNQYWLDCLTEKANTASACIKHLSTIKTEWLQNLERNPHVHAFQNGLFVTTQNEFFYFEPTPGKRCVDELSGNTTAIKYHDMIFDEEGMESDMREVERMTGIRTYMAIDLPAVNTILTTQDFDIDERRWIFCMLGRLLFSVGQMDTWSVFPYFLGLAGTGKSTCLRLVSELFEKRDVGYLNNVSQKMFALDGLADKSLYLALDIDGDFSLDQATFQSMVCGEEVCVVQKYKQPLTMPWKIHGGFAGNVLPSWSDNGGSLARRLIIIEFQKCVRNVDPNLFEKCVMQKDRFLKVITSAYHEMTAHFKNQGIKEVMPDRFKVSEKKALLELNSLLQFVTEYCDIEQLGEGADAKQVLIQPFKEFNAAFRDYCKRLAIKSKTLNYSFYNGVFAKFQIVVVDPTRQDPYNQTSKYIKGLRLKDQNPPES